jgi:CRP-like cAMP-binding protein
MRTIDQLLTEAPAFEGMDSAHLELIAGCARNEIFKQGAYVMREGDAADRFYVIRAGRLAMETFIPQRGGLTVETIEAGELLGWSWLVPPYRVHLDVLALTEIHAIAFDAKCLRGKCEQDPALGYELMKRFLPVIVERLQATRLRLLDVYGPMAAQGE